MSVNARLSIRNSYIDAGGTSVRSRIGVRRPNRDGVRAIGQDERVQVEVEAHVGTAGPPRVDTAHDQAVNPVGSRAHQHAVHLYLHTAGIDGCTDPSDVIDGPTTDQNRAGNSRARYRSVDVDARLSIRNTYFALQQHCRNLHRSDE